jgi:hypothetical protein
MLRREFPIRATLNPIATLQRAKRSGVVATEEGRRLSGGSTEREVRMETTGDRSLRC